ncbi:MAG: hypothetical protein WAU47_09360, partial [Desulfobaccales bacterium]
SGRADVIQVETSAKSLVVILSEAKDLFFQRVMRFFVASLPQNDGLNLSFPGATWERGQKNLL